MDDDDISLKIALGVVGGVIALVLALALGLAISQTFSGEPANATTNVTSADGLASTGASTPSIDSEIPTPIGDALARLYFALDQAVLPDDANTVLVAVVAAAQDKPDKIVLISGFHDASGDAVHNAELAKQRALTVRDALVAAGLDSGRIRLSKPAVTEGSGEAPEARRVELRVQ